MRTLFRSLFAGTTAAAALAAVAYWQDMAPWPDGARLVGLAGGSVVIAWWVLAAGAATRDKLSERARLRRAQRHRRAALAASRAYEPTPTFGDPDAEATSAMPAPGQFGARHRQSLRDKATHAVEKGQFVQARRLLSQVLLTRATVADHLSRGRVSLDLGDFNRAIADFMAAEDLAPVDARPPAALGDLYFARRDHARALDHYAAARALDPRNAMVRYRRGLCHYELYNGAAAVKELRRARALDPDLPQVDRYIELARRRASTPRPDAGKRPGADVPAPRPPPKAYHV